MCNELSNALKDWMDPTIDPCDDFYQFTCGKFIKEATVNPRLGTTPPLASDLYQGKNITWL